MDTQSTDGEHRLIRVQITLTVERDLQAHGLFPDVRLPKAARVAGTTGTHVIGQPRASELLGYAKARRQSSQLAPGMAKAYTALVHRLTVALREYAVQQDVAPANWRLPTADEMQRRCDESLARFRIGERALFFDDGDEYGTRVQVISALGLYRVRRKDGHFVNEDGSRVDLMFGYGVTSEDGERFFCQPFQLTHEDCRVSHLRLAVSNRSTGSASQAAHR